MDLEKIYVEEDLFPREITFYEKRDYGFLFYNEENKDSYDSNHALIFKDKVSDLKQTLDDIIRFYTEKGISPNIYQSICDTGYFEEMKDKLLEYGFKSWTEPQKYMILSEKSEKPAFFSQIVSNTKIVVRKVSEWKEEYGTEIFEKAGEPWEIGVAKRALDNRNTLFFVAFYENQPVGMTYAHINSGVCRVNYLLVPNEHRNNGVGRALMHCFSDYCERNQIKNCYLWTDGETAEKIYYEAGFRYIETRQAGRAAYVN